MSGLFSCHGKARSDSLQSADMEFIRTRCICDLFSWENVLGRRNVLAFSPFSAIKASADSRCHLCSLLYGSLRVYNGPQGTTKLKPDCGCVTENEAAFRIFGQSNVIIIEVSCKGQRHMAMLNLSTMPHNCLPPTICSVNSLIS